MQGMYLELRWTPSRSLFPVPRVEWKQDFKHFWDYHRAPRRPAFGMLVGVSGGAGPGGRDENPSPFLISERL